MLNLIRKLVSTGRLGQEENEMLLLGQPVQIIPVSFMTNLTDSLVEEGREQILFEAGRNSVSDFVEGIKGPQKFKDLDMIKFLERLGSSAGWGHIEMLELDENPVRAVFTLEEPAISRRCKTKGKIDHIFAGMVVGAFEQTYGGRFEAEEKECVADGADKCRLEIKEFTE